MHHTPLTTEECDDFLLVKQKAHCFALQFGAETTPEQRMTCHFLEHNQDMSRDMNALVLAPAQDVPLLSHRIVSFLSAHLRINDRTGLEKSILNGIRHQYNRQQEQQLEHKTNHPAPTLRSTHHQPATPFPSPWRLHLKPER
ncbi:MAG: hypothetical protein KDI15_04960 [Thiothrix sp.]|nr:hypothetical protein [Thiothrix sp.]HPE62047.1 hypothetical protein [Thiolinea sp.]